MRKVHFIGIGGIGMSALADILLAKGVGVTGSDIRPNNLTRKLFERGAGIFEGHSDENIVQGTDLVVRTMCIRDDNPELVKARELDIPVIMRSELLKKVLEESEFSVGVTGTHGKTTTSALIAHVLEKCGKNPTVLIGGELDTFSGNAKTGDTNFIVAEVDESDGFFKNFKSSFAVITNIEREHIENYGSFDNLLKAYKDFIGGVSQNGFLIVNGEDPVLDHLSKDSLAERITFGIDGKVDVTCQGVSHEENIVFDFVMNGKKYGTIRSSLIGRYNVMNILAAVTAGLNFGFSFERMAKAISSFKGVKRRFELVEEVKKIKVVEDYAHHPTEIKAVIGAAKKYTKGKVITVFQPHRYSRTRDLLREFSGSFYSSDVLILTEIYSADEEESARMSARKILDHMDTSRFESLDFVEKKDIPGYVARIAKEEDIVLVLGAGDIREVAAPIAQEIKKGYSGC